MLLKSRSKNEGNVPRVPLLCRAGGIKHSSPRGQEQHLKDYRSHLVYQQGRNQNRSIRRLRQGQWLQRMFFCARHTQKQVGEQPLMAHSLSWQFLPLLLVKPVPDVCLPTEPASYPFLGLCTWFPAYSV